MDDTSFPRAQKQAPTLHQDRPTSLEEFLGPKSSRHFMDGFCYWSDEELQLPQNGSRFPMHANRSPLADRVLAALPAAFSFIHILVTFFSILYLNRRARDSNPLKYFVNLGLDMCILSAHMGCLIVYHQVLYSLRLTYNGKAFVFKILWNCMVAACLVYSMTVVYLLYEPDAGESGLWLFFISPLFRVALPIPLITCLIQAHTSHVNNREFGNSWP